MQFTSFSFACFFPIVLFIYYLVPKKARAVWLLLASYYFYMNWNPKYAILIFLSTLITYLSGIFLSKIPNENRKLRKWILGGSLIGNLSILLFFKYFYFLFDSISFVFDLCGISLKSPGFDIILPVGISFYTFQALGYTIDVYRNDITAEKKFVHYALFVSFFPQLVAGPIERSGHLMGQLHDITEHRKWNFDQFTRGMLMMLWGYFMKLVIADRAAIFVDQVFSHYYAYYGVTLLLGAILFCLQLYCDFASYSAIAIGAAAMLGIELMPNFAAPFFSKSVGEFWRRWHISLSQWLRDYIYISLGGNRGSKLKKYGNRLFTFCVSGLWHGASWHYVLWGVLQGIFINMEEIVSPWKDKYYRKFGVKTQSIGFRITQVLITNVLVIFSFIFFRADTIRDAVLYIRRIFIHFDPWNLLNGSIYTTTMEYKEFVVLFFAVVCLFLVDLYYQKKRVFFDSLIKNQCLAVQYLAAVCMVIMILVFGIYGEGYDATQFIYFQF